MYCLRLAAGFRTAAHLEAPPERTSISLESDALNPENPPVEFRKVTIAGVGLLGGSLGLALKQRGLARHICGYVRRERAIDECIAAGAVDTATCDLQEAVTGADLVVLCTPVGQMPGLFKAMRNWLRHGCLLTDVGSVKRDVVTPIERLATRSGVEFVGSHPMTGSEKTGVGAARADLFVGALCVVTSTRKTNAASFKRIEALWHAVGSQVLRMSPREHDQLVSRSSHLPYLLAAQLANNVLNPSLPALQSRLCAGAFRDMTRIAAGSPEMWRDICLANGDFLCDAVDDFINGLEAVRQAIRNGKGESVVSAFEQARSRREAWAAGVSLGPKD